VTVLPARIFSGGTGTASLTVNRFGVRGSGLRGEVKFELLIYDLWKKAKYEYKNLMTLEYAAINIKDRIYP
jgi:hypothetical protein